MKSLKKAETKNSVGRCLLVALFFIIQTLWILLLVVKLNNYSVFISGLTSIISAVVVINICANDMNSDMKLLWVILILVFPIMGISIYLMYGRKDVTKGKRRAHEQLRERISKNIRNQKEHAVSEHTNDETAARKQGNSGQANEKQKKCEQTNRKLIKDAGVANQCYYLEKCAGFPLYQNTEVIYYKDAIDGWNAQMEAMKSAKRYIFMEYHAIENVEPFTEMKEILIEKVNQGVDVRIIYDDVGSMGFITPDFVKEMESYGIGCRIFNPIVPALRIFMNNRDHRKITVIDGKIGFTGGYNLAHKYFNLTEPYPYGYWKDTGIRMTGDAVASLTAMFLEMWNFIEKTDTEFERYFTTNLHIEKEDMLTDRNEKEVLPVQNQHGFVLPYSDSPLDDELVGENVYLNMIKNAKEYIWFTTPYLIISDVLSRELCLAAKRGIDVRIITPGIPDKKLVYQVTRSYYPELLKAGVRIFEFTPGFCHAKQCVCDGETAVIGTINLDYRSLYHHFENGVFLYQVDAIEEMRKDFIETFEKCREVPVSYGEKRSVLLRLAHEFLHLFASLL